jgi:hypothetical protein
MFEVTNSLLSYNGQHLHLALLHFNPTFLLLTPWKWIYRLPSLRSIVKSSRIIGLPPENRIPKGKWEEISWFASQNTVQLPYTKEGDVGRLKPTRRGKNFVPIALGLLELSRWNSLKSEPTVTVAAWHPTRTPQNVRGFITWSTIAAALFRLLHRSQDEQLHPIFLQVIVVVTKWIKYWIFVKCNAGKNHTNFNNIIFC